MKTIKNYLGGVKVPVILWLLGVPLPIIFIIFLMRGCN